MQSAVIFSSFRATANDEHAFLIRYERIRLERLIAGYWRKAKRKHAVYITAESYQRFAEIPRAREDIVSKHTFALASEETKERFKRACGRSIDQSFESRMVICRSSRISEDQSDDTEESDDSDESDSDD